MKVMKHPYDYQQPYTYVSSEILTIFDYFDFYSKHIHHTKLQVEK
jgi:hypothetical protein